jgi:Predicted enzyme related to lactoylglutathione lyase
MTDQGYPHGTFCWADLATIDLEAAKAFYAALFGWEYADAPSPNMPYTLITHGDGKVGGLFAQPDDMRAAGIPPCWTPYISTEGLDAVAARIPGLGGKVICAPFDIPDTGRMTTIADPEGAVVNLWSREACASGAGGLASGPGTMCWNELATSDLDSAASFYSALFDWAVKPMRLLDHVYVEFILEGEPVGGMLPLSAAGPDLPPHWMVHFAVEDCDATVATATAHGAQVRKGAFDVPEVGRLAILADPQGAVFAVIARAS